MQRPVFSLFLLLFTGLLSQPVAHAAGCKPAAPQDTIVVRLPNQATLTLMVRDAAQLRQLKTYHLDSLTSRLASYIDQAEKAAQTSPAQRVTMEFYPDRDQPGQRLPEQIRITTHKQQPHQNRVDVALNKAFGVKTTVDADGRKSYVFGNEEAARKKSVAADSAHQKENHHDKHTVYMRLDVGLSNFANGQASTAGGVPGLSTWDSHYVNIGLDYLQPLLYRQHTKLALTFGPEFSFYRFGLQGNKQWVARDGRTVAEQVTDKQHIDQAKLYMTTLNLPLMLQFKMRNARDKTTLSAGVGGFGGYRLSSSSRVEYQLDGSDYDHEDKTSGAFHLNNWQYGLQAEIGFHALTFFARYHLNEVFQTGKGPQTHAISFGLAAIGF